MIKCFYCNRECANGIWIIKFNGVRDIIVKSHRTCYNRDKIEVIHKSILKVKKVNFTKYERWCML